VENEDIFGKFRRRNEPLSYYWKAVKSAMDSPILITNTLQNRFWPSSRFGPSIEDEFHDDNTIYEKYTEDAPFVGHRRNRLAP
jgi:hypothetical protein